MGHHANGEIVVDLGGQFKTFEAEVGVQWQGGKNIGSVVFQIYVDDKKVFDSGVVRENDPPRPVTVSVEGAEELRLVANDAGDGIDCDCADWADARLTRDPAAAKEIPESSDRHRPLRPGARLGSESHGGNEGQPGGGNPRRRHRSLQGSSPVGRRNLSRVPWRTARAASACNGTRTGCFAAPWRSSFPNAAAVPPGRVGPIAVLDVIGPARIASAWQGKWQSAGIAPEKVGKQSGLAVRLQTRLPEARRRSAGFLRRSRATDRAEGLSPPTPGRAGRRWTSASSRRGRVRRPKAEIEVYNGDLLNAAGEIPLPLRVGRVETALAESSLQRSPALQGRSDRAAVPIAGRGLRRGDRGPAGQRLRVRAARRRVRHARCPRPSRSTISQEDRRPENGARASSAKARPGFPPGLGGGPQSDPGSRPDDDLAGLRQPEVPRPARGRGSLQRV